MAGFYFLEFSAGMATVVFTVQFIGKALFVPDD
jgi:hypothetical protein